MKILWLTWKDRAHPLAGGAETVNEELARRLIADGHEVIFLVSGFKGAQIKETVKFDATFNFQLQIVRLGNRWTVYWQAFRYYQTHLQEWPDLVIDEVNTIPFLARFYVKQPNVVFAHMLCRQIWWYEMAFPLSLLGYLLEPLYLRLLADLPVVTVSNSTKLDLQHYGFKPNRIHIIPEGIDIKPLATLSPQPSTLNPVLLSLGSIRPMKRTLDQIKAFERAKLKVKSLKLKVAGDASSYYGQKVLRYIQKSPYANDIQYLGQVSGPERLELLQSSHIIMVTSVKEGWGLIVTEAASQGTPAVVYDVDGLRDSVRSNQTGIICRDNTPAALADSIVGLLNDPTRYEALRTEAWQWSQQFTFDASYQAFLKILQDALKAQTK